MAERVLESRRESGISCKRPVIVWIQLDPWIQLIFQREIGQCLDTASMRWMWERENVEVSQILAEGC